MASLHGREYLELDVEYSRFGRCETEDENELMRAALEKRSVDVRKLDRLTRQLLVNNALATSEQDNFKLLYAIKQRLDRVGLEIPKVEVRNENINISTNVKVGSRALPTLLNFGYDVIERTGNITYNGHTEDEFCVQTTRAYISQIDNHTAELTVRETLDFTARCQGASHGFRDLSKIAYPPPRGIV